MEKKSRKEFLVEGTETLLGKCKVLQLGIVGYGNIYS